MCVCVVERLGAVAAKQGEHSTTQQHVDAVGQEKRRSGHLRAQDSATQLQPVLLMDWDGFTIFEWIMFLSIYI